MRTRPIGEVLAALRALGVDVDDEGRGALPFTVRGAGVGARRHGGDRRVGVVAVRLGAAAGGRPLRARRRRTPRRQAGPVAAPHRDDRGDAARARRRGRRLRREPLGGRARPGARPRPPSSPTCPTPRRSSRWPRSPAARSPCATGRGRPRRPATRCARSWPAMGCAVDFVSDGLRVTGPGDSARRSRRRPARRRRAHPGRRRAVRAGRLAVAPARHRAHPRPRDRPAGRAGHRARRPRRRRHRARRRAVVPARPRCTAGSSTPTPTTGWRTPA